ncbi:glycine cleavage T C-terminal barrel domain-containing protein [Nonomuraea dietziae]|uniref:glycine cleavage T C-terminal barrel domain-containing protein n=1 Tax=Nonomuraea dietziae TaxID=65515 RepID=UPI003614092C
MCLGGEPVRVDGAPASRVTSGGYGHRVDASIAYAYLRGAPENVTVGGRHVGGGQGRGARAVRPRARARQVTSSTIFPLILPAKSASAASPTRATSRCSPRTSGPARRTSTPTPPTRGGTPTSPG